MKLNLRTVCNGLFLIFLGVVLLLINYGLVGWNFFAAFIDYWPVVLIVLGLGLLFNRRVPASLGLLVLGLVMLITSIFAPPAKNQPFFYNMPYWFNTSHETTTIPVEYPLDKALSKGKVQINGGGASINISDTDNGFVKGEITSYGGNPRTNFDAKGSEGSLTIDANWSGRGNSGDKFNLNLTNQIPLDVTVNAGAISGDMDFSRIKLSRLEINCGASDNKIKFGATGMKTDVQVSSAASKLTLAIPQEVGVRIKYSGLPIGDINLSNGATFSKQNDTYTTANYSSSASTLDIEVSGAATQINVVQP